MQFDYEAFVVQTSSRTLESVYVVAGFVLLDRLEPHHAGRFVPSVPTQPRQSTGIGDPMSAFLVKAARSFARHMFARKRRNHR